MTNPVDLDALEKKFRSGAWCDWMREEEYTIIDALIAELRRLRARVGELEAIVRGCPDCRLLAAVTDLVGGKE